MILMRLDCLVVTRLLTICMPPLLILVNRDVCGDLHKLMQELKDVILADIRDSNILRFSRRNSNNRSLAGKQYDHHPGKQHSQSVIAQSESENMQRLAADAELSPKAVLPSLNASLLCVAVSRYFNTRRAARK